MTENFTAEGGCACKEVRYRVNARPMIVHCCNCRWCQRETGAAFALNALVETAEVELLAGETAEINTPSQSGGGQKIHRCPKCSVAVWSHYPGAGVNIAFIRVGTLDDPHQCPPEVCIFTSSKQPWVTLPKNVPAFDEFYVPSEFWPPASMERMVKARGPGWVVSQFEI